MPLKRCPNCNMVFKGGHNPKTCSENLRLGSRSLKVPGFKNKIRSKNRLTKISMNQEQARERLRNLREVQSKLNIAPYDEASEKEINSIYKPNTGKRRTMQVNGWKKN